MAPRVKQPQGRGRVQLDSSFGSPSAGMLLPAPPCWAPAALCDDPTVPQAPADLSPADDAGSHPLLLALKTLGFAKSPKGGLAGVWGWGQGSQLPGAVTGRSKVPADLQAAPEARGCHRAHRLCRRLGATGSFPQERHPGLLRGPTGEPHAVPPHFPRDPLHGVPPSASTCPCTTSTCHRQPPTPRHVWPRCGASCAPRVPTPTSCPPRMPTW